MEADEIAHNYFKHLERGRLLIDVSRWREALHEYGQHLANFPDNYGALCQSALCHYELKEFQRAYDVTKRAIEVEPENEWAYRLQSLIFTRNGEPKRALDAAKTCVEKDPGSPFTVQCLFWAQAEHGSLDEAEVTLKSLTEMSPGSATTHEAAGYLALKRKQNLEAEKHYLEALKIDPESVNALNNLGVAYLNLAQSGKGHHYKKKSVEMFERAVKVEPTFTLAQRNWSNASNAVRIGLPAGFIFLGWMALRFAGTLISWIVSPPATHSVDSSSSAFTPVTSSYLLTAANLCFSIVFTGVIAAAMVCLIPRHREVILYQLATIWGWLYLLFGFGVIAIMYVVGFWVLGNDSTIFSAAAFGISLTFVFFALLNTIRQWASRAR